MAEGIEGAKRERKRAEIKERLEEVAAREVEDPTGVYAVVVIAPPWPMEETERREQLRGSSHRVARQGEACLRF